MAHAKPAIALLPLDERPVNTSLVADVARAAGYDLALPPAGILSHYREGGDTEALAAWLTQRAADANTRAIVVSIDMLVFGGLIPARVTHEELSTVVARFDVLSEIKRARPELPLLAVSLVTRASNSNSNMEEPEYWSDFGTTIHALGADAHRAWQNGDAATAADAAAEPDSNALVAADGLPQDVRRDFASRRLRNHIVNLAAIDLRAEGVLDYLAVTADDTAAHSAGSVEQNWLSYWGVLDPLMAVPIYPGADETGAVLVSRALCLLEGVQPVVDVIMAEPSGWNRIPPYENVPLALSIPRQLDAAGARRSEQGEPADLTLVVHPSDPDRADQGDVVAPVDDPSATAATVNAVRKAVEGAGASELVALADLRYANGADPSLIEALREAGLLTKLAAYGGWNTAGNALGSTIALGVAAVLAERQGRADAAGLRLTRARRLLDDYAYQTVLRRRFAHELFHNQIDPMDAADVAIAEARLTSELQKQLEEFDPDAPFRVAQVRLPWARRFEVDVRFDCEESADVGGR